jgi:hypothetical protein
MLCQLVCVDRRYQRMNSFNIRELQSILQRRFFSDLVNTADHRNLLDSLAISLRFKANANDFIRPEQPLFYNFGLNKSPHLKLIPTESTIYSNYTPLHISHKIIPNLKPDLLSSYYEYLQSLVNYAKIIALTPFYKIIDLLLTLPAISTTPFYAVALPANLKLNFLNLLSYFTFTPLLYTPTALLSNFSANKPVYTEKPVNSANSVGTNINYVTDNHTATLNTQNLPFLFSESSNSYRFLKFNNPLINYDYKCGHYLTI